jgi:ubiquinone/menaquinone biosynthesis C-methylase UbiE
VNHSDHVYLLEGDPGVRERLGLPLRGAAGYWADLGSGSGAFTLALADLLGPAAVIISIDKDQSVLREQEMAMRKMSPNRQVEYQQGDFTRPLALPPLDGVVMANSLHFLPNDQKTAFLTRLRGLIRSGGQLILVEYNTDRGNVWVPYPLSYPIWEKTVRGCGYTQTARLGARPSRFLGEIYSAVSRVE